MGRFRDLQMVTVRDEEVLGYIVSSRQSGDGKEYHVMYWKDGRRDDGWFAEHELEAAP